jgi:putative sterol carrier protein
MAKWLSPEWFEIVLDMAKSQPERPGATAKMQYVITDAPEGGEIHYYWIVENGKLLEAKLGDLPDAEFTMTMSYSDHMKMAKSELDPNTAFLQGRIKVTGNMAKLMGLLPITNSPEYKQLMKDIEAKTEF